MFGRVKIVFFFSELILFDQQNNEMKGIILIILTSLIKLCTIQ